MADKVSITICGDGGCGMLRLYSNLRDPVANAVDRKILNYSAACPIPVDIRIRSYNRYVLSCNACRLRILTDRKSEDSYSVTRTVDGIPYFLSLTDTAGQEEYRGLWAASNLKSDAFLLVYDITNSNSLETLEYFMDMIDIETEQRMEENSRRIRVARAASNGRPINYDSLNLAAPPVKIIAGNKCDLKDARVITSREGLEWARKKGCGFMETSAREMVNIEETFALIVRRTVEARKFISQGGADPQAPPPVPAKGGAGGATARGHSRNQTSVSQTAPLSPLRDKFDTGSSDAGQTRRPWWKKMFCIR